MRGNKVHDKKKRIFPDRKEQLPMEKSLSSTVVKCWWRFILVKYGKARYLCRFYKRCSASINKQRQVLQTPLLPRHCFPWGVEVSSFKFLICKETQHRINYLRTTHRGRDRGRDSREGKACVSLAGRLAINCNLNKTMDLYWWCWCMWLGWPKYGHFV